MQAIWNKLYSNSGNPAVINMVPADTNLKILDIGCGAGDNASILKSRGYELDGITASMEEFGVAKKYFNKIFVHNLELGLPVECTGKYDVIIMSHVLEHIAYPEKLLRDIQKVMLPTSVLIIALPNLMHYRSRIELLIGNFDYQDSGIWDYTHLRWYTLKSSKAMLENMGYIVKHQEVSGELPFGRMTRKMIPLRLNRILFNLLKRWAPGLFGDQILLIAGK